MPDVDPRLAAALADRYRLEREIGAGGMATVYLAQDLRHGRSVALKVLRPELAAVIGADRFLAEIKTTAALQHPHILPLFDSGHADGFLFYVMPLIEGESLRDRLEEHQLPVDDAVRLAREIGSALDYAHRHGVIHRDIKPENILLHDGAALVADFGIALAVSHAGGSRMTETGLSLGTPGYMSPEQATGERGLDARSDVYSLGCLLYEMLAGEPPHTGPTIQAVIAAVVTKDPERLGLRRRSVPGNVEAAVHKALAKLPADRFATAESFVKALSEPATAPSMTAYTGGVPVTAPSRRLTVAGVTMILLLAALAAWGWFRPRANPFMNRYAMAFTTDQAVSSTALAGRVAISPDGKRVAYVGKGEGTTRLWIKEAGQVQPTPLAGTDGATSPFFLPRQSWGRLHQGREDGPDPAARRRCSPHPDRQRQHDRRIVGGRWLRLLRGGLRHQPDPRHRRAHRAGLQVCGLRSRPWHRMAGRAAGRARGPLPPPARGADRHRLRHHGQAVAEGRGEDSPSWGIRALLAVRSSAGGHLRRQAPGRSIQPEQAGVDRSSVRIVRRPRTQSLRCRDRTLRDRDPGLPDRESVLIAGTGLGVPQRGHHTGGPRVESRRRRRLIRIVSQRPGHRGGAAAERQVGHLGQAAARRAVSRITFGDTAFVRPTWKPDGSEVYYLADRGDGGGLPTARRADGVGAATRLTQLRKAFGQILDSPDGKWLILRSAVAEVGNGEIFGLKSGDTTLVPLVTSPAREGTPALSPDGKWLAYSSDESGGFEVYVRPFPNTAGARWQVSTAGGTQPLWSHSGKELFFRNNHGDLVAAEVKPGPSFSVGEQKTLFPLGPFSFAGPVQLYAVSPDDKSFLMMRETSAGESGALVVSENWFEELKARAK